MLVFLSFGSSQILSAKFQSTRNKTTNVATLVSLTFHCEACNDYLCVSACCKISHEPVNKFSIPPQEVATISN